MAVIESFLGFVWRSTARHNIWFCLALLLGSTVYAGNNVWTGPWHSGIAMTDMSTVSSTGKMYAVANGYSDTLYVSRDGGSSWGMEAAVLPASGSTFSRLTLDPQNANIIFALNSTYAHRSVDGGLSWARTTNATYPSAVTVRGLTVYVSNAYNPIFEKSTDGGLTFTKVSSTYAQDITTTADGTVYIATATGVSKSTNGGVTFNPTGLVNIDIGKVRAAPDGTLYASSGSNLYVSLNQGASWSFSQPSTKLTLGLDTAFKALNVASDNTVFAMIAGVIVKSADRGVTWITINPVVSGNQQVSSIAQEAANPQNLYALSTGVLMKSTDAGKNWRTSSATTFNTTYGTGYLVRHFALPIPTLFVKSSYSHEANLLKLSKDGGSTFVDAIFPTSAFSAIFDIIQSPSTKTTFYAATDKGVFRSLDSGMNWSKLTAGLPANASHNAIAIDPQNANILYTSAPIGNTNLLHRSVDGGATWAQAGLPLVSNITSILVVGGIAYVTSYGNGLFVSTDSGQSWTSQNSGTTIAKFTKIVVSPTNAANLFLVGEKGNVYQSLNAGTTWTALNYRLPNDQDITDLIVGPDGKTLHIAMPRSYSSSSGYYQYTINPPIVGTLIDVYRLYSPVTEGFLYTSDANEYQVLTTAANWRGDGKVYRALAAPGSIDAVATTPYYRLYSPVLRRHLWTTDLNEYTVLATRNWLQDGVAWHMSNRASDTSTALYRLYSETGRKHFYTINLDEKNKLASEGWTDEGAVGYVLRPTP